MASKKWKDKYKNVPDIKYNDSGNPIKPEGWSVVKWGGYLQDAEKFYNKKSEKWKPGKYLEMLKLKRKMKKTKKQDY